LLIFSFEARAHQSTQRENYYLFFLPQRNSFTPLEHQAAADVCVFNDSLWRNYGVAFSVYTCREKCIICPRAPSALCCAKWRGVHRRECDNWRFGEKRTFGSRSFFNAAHATQNRTYTLTSRQLCSAHNTNFTFLLGNIYTAANQWKIENLSSVSLFGETAW
jgi:hypothetical protein